MGYEKEINKLRHDIAEIVEQLHRIQSAWAKTRTDWDPLNNIPYHAEVEYFMKERVDLKLRLKDMLEKQAAEKELFGQPLSLTDYIQKAES